MVLGKGLYILVCPLHTIVFVVSSIMFNRFTKENV